MPFVKGKPRPKNSGRRKGTRNKVFLAVKERLEQLGCDPIEGMALIAQDPKAPMELRAKMFAELATYLHPKLKAIQHSGIGLGGALDVNLNNVSATELLTSRIASLVAKAGLGTGDQKPK